MHRFKIYVGFLESEIPSFAINIIPVGAKLTGCDLPILPPFFVQVILCDNSSIDFPSIFVYEVTKRKEGDLIQCHHHEGVDIPLWKRKIILQLGRRWWHSQNRGSFPLWGCIDGHRMRGKSIRRRTIGHEKWKERVGAISASGNSISIGLIGSWIWKKKLI